MKDLQGKQVLVTGGSRGIGAAIALTLARNGADVAISYEHAADRAQDIVDQIDREGQHGVAIHADSADPDANERLVEHAVRDLGGLDILVNNAGTIRHGDLVDLSPDDISTVLHVNVRGTVLTTRAAIPHFTRGLARELGPTNITVNLVQPGPIDTALNPGNGGDADYIRSLVPLGRYGTTDEVAALVPSWQARPLHT
ncbi:SDR family NAD(P)-dependent oxidoreductase [Streptomyces niveus]|uniref:SDR family NAD(P)-dependent oxidoreductase n=1 Tax=Streptomyces niveus TaxID=193462 RepID=UPI000990579D